ncbi:MAG: hypothetical protein ACREBS_07290 [Nitrososphaerales archaeon]
MQLGLGTVDLQDSSLPYAPTDLFGSPGYGGITETSVGFIAPQTETLTKFEVNVIGADIGSNMLNITVRSNNNTIGPHPASTKYTPVLGRFSETLSAINSTFVPCGTTTGYCTWVNATFSPGVSLTVGQYYWIVMNTTGNSGPGSKCTVCLLRLNNGYQFPVYDSSNDFVTNWAVPADGPSDLSFQVVTSGADINNTVVGSNQYEFGQYASLGSFAQSFEVSHNSQLKEILSPFGSGSSYEQVTMSVETDSGSDSPSGRILATAVDSEILNHPLNLTAGTKYWIVWSETCLMVGYCSNPTKIGYTQFRSDASSSIKYGGGVNLHIEIYNLTSGSWLKYPYDDTTFILMDSNSTINVYSTTQLYDDISANVPSQWNSFLDYYQSTLMYNLTQVMAGMGKSMIYYTGLAPTFGDMTNINYGAILQTNSGAGGGFGYDCVTNPSCGGNPSFYASEISDYLGGILGNAPQSNFLMWASIGDISDNQGGVTPSNLLNEYLTVLPSSARPNLLFNDWCYGLSCLGINNMTQNQYTRAFGTIVNRMVYEGDFYGVQKDAVKLLWVESPGNDGSFPAYLESAINVTVTTDTNLTNVNLNQFNVIGGTALNSLTTIAQARVQAFVKDGGGYVNSNFGGPSQENNILGLASSTVSSGGASSLTILTPNKITSPYSAISYTPYFVSNQVSELGNESAQVFVKDSNNNPVITANNYYGGIGVLIEQPDYSRLGYLSQDSSFINLYINAIYYAAHKGNMLPITWQSSYVDVPPSISFYESTDGSPGNPVLFWASNNAGTVQSLDVHLNATFYDISTQGWLAINMQNMAVVAKGTGTDIHISMSVPAETWAPIYIINDTSDLQPLYSTASILSSSSSSGSESYNLAGSENSSSWAVLTSTSYPISISSSLTGSIPSYSSLSSLNQTQIGYYCTSVSASACTSWAARSQEGYYYDPTNNLLYVHYRGGSSITLSVSSSGSATSSTTTTTSSSSSTTSTSSANAVFSNPRASSTVVNQNTQFSLKWSDSSGIAGYIFSYDSGSGSFVNDSYVSLANPTSAWTNTTKTIPGTAGERIQWAYYLKDANGIWTKSYTYSFVAGVLPSAVSLANFRLMTDDAYDLLAYDGTNLANLGNFPQFVGTYGSFVGFHQVSWNPQGTLALAIGYNNSAILYTKSTGSIKVFSTGVSSATNLDGVAWTPNGTSAVLTGSSPDVILAYSTTSGKFTQESNPTGVTGLGAVDWKPASNYALITGSDGLIKYSDGGSLRLIPSASGISFKGISFNPNGTMALLGAGGGSIYEYSSASSSVSLLTTLSGITQLQQVKFSRDGAYALLTAQSGSTSDLYKFDGKNVYPITSASSNTGNEISFSPDDSYAMITTTGGGLLIENYNSNYASLATISPNTRLRGIDFLPPTIVITTTTTTTTSSSSTSSSSSLGFISIQASGTPYDIGTPITLSGNTLQSPAGSAVPSQAVYIWINGVSRGSVTSSSSGSWAFSFTPTSTGTYYTSASQSPDGSGVTSQQLALTVPSVSTSTSSTTTTTITTSQASSSSTTSTTGTSTTTTSSSTTTTSTSSNEATSSSTTTSTGAGSTSTTNQSALVTTTSSSSSTSNSSFTSNSTATTSSSQTAIGSSSNTTSSSTSSANSSGQPTQTTQPKNFAALFGFIPFVTSSSPTPLGTAIFAYEVGLVTAAPFILRKVAKRTQDQGREESRGWRW